MPGPNSSDKLRVDNELLQSQLDNMVLEIANIRISLRQFATMVLLPRGVPLIIVGCLAWLLTARLPGIDLSFGWVAALVLIFPADSLISKSEGGSRPNINAAAAIAALTFSVLLFLSRRPAFAALVTLAAFRGLIDLSELKFKYLHTYLHAYDALYYLRNAAALRFLFGNLPRLVISQLAKLFAGVLLLILVCVVEPAAIDRSVAAVGILVSLIAFAITRPNIERNHANHFWRPSHISHFTESVAEACKAWHRGGALATQKPVDTAPRICAAPVRKLDRAPPNIILILQESTFPPWLYPSIPYDPALGDFFQSADGLRRELRVEIYGGASWVTEFSALTGIPANSYGDLRPYVYQFATGNIRHSLPFCLRTFGFRNVTVYPAKKDFIATDKFLSSIGFDDIIDRKAMRTTRDREPDSFYFSRSIEWLTTHFATSGRPSFVYMLTSSNHDPHSLQYMPDSGTMVPIENDRNAELNEYLRRLNRSAKDYANFRSELAARFPDREFLIVHFGDHQPPFTWQMFGHSHSWHGDLKRYPVEELAYRTYCAIDGVNFRPHRLNEIPATFEVAYLGTVLLMAAGLPLEGVNAFRRELMGRHSGRLFFADAGGSEALQLNYRLIQAGLVGPH